MQNIDSDLIRGNIDTIILKTMLNEDKYGLDIIKEVEQRSNGTYELKQPTLYSCLKRLENQQLISSYWLNSDIGGRRHYYKLTEKGREFYNKKQEEWAKSKFVIDNLLSNYNYEEYRLVKKDEYDKVLNASVSSDVDDESKQEDLSSDQFFDDNYDDETTDETIKSSFENLNDEQENLELDIDEENSPIALSDNESFEDENIQNEEFDELDSYNNSYSEFESLNEENNLGNEPIENSEDSDENEVIYIENSEDSNEDIEENESYPSYDLPDQTENENNILNMLRNQQKEEINTYEGDKKSYASQIRSIYDDVKYVQDDMIFATNEEADEVDEKIKEFEDVAQKLNNFENKISDEESDDEQYFNTEINDDIAFEIENSEDEINYDEIDSEFDSGVDDNINNFEIIEENENQEINDIIDFDEDDLEEESLNENLENLNEGSQIYSPQNTSFFNSEDYEDSLSPEEYFADEQNDFEIENDESNYEENDETFSNYSEEFNQSYDESFKNNSFNKDEYDSTFVNVRKDNSSEAQVDYDSSIEKKDIDSIISKNVSGFSLSNEKNELFERRYIGENYKQKLSNLTIYSRVSTDSANVKKQNEVAEADDMETLKLNFEQEGIKVKEFKKMSSIENHDKTYLLTNKINLIKSIILFFGYSFLLTGLYFILKNTSIGFVSEFSFAYFAYGMIPFAIVMAYNLILYVINPYKKIPARYASRIMGFLTIIITVQLLLITYCVNLQLGFYSFTQAGYNHLLWIIPSVISFGPIVSNFIYMVLFHSGNFKV